VPVVVKRSFDLAAAGLLLVLFSPVMALTAVIVWLQMGHPVLFTQLRPGLRGRPFKLYKLRTMRHALDGRGEPLPDDQRLTACGRRIRRLSLDELPQLFNVIKGDMSLVGPRPLLMEYLPLYSPEQARRHDVRPGITGWAQVNGRNAISWEEKFAHDVWYVDHQSFWLDMKILFLTAKKVVVADGVDNSREVTMPKFTGSGDA
jgi:sugar transferase EpsL